MLLFLDFDGVLHTLFEVDEITGCTTTYRGPYFVHASLLSELLRPHLAKLEIIVSSTWGRKRCLRELQALLSVELAARVTDAVHHNLLPLKDFQRGHGLASRWAEIGYYRAHVRPDIGDRWLAIDDDDLGWPDGERHHLAHCAKDLGAAATQAAVTQAVKDWLAPGRFPPPPVVVGVQADRRERFIAHDPLKGAAGRTYEADTAEQLVRRLWSAGLDPGRVTFATVGPHVPSPVEAQALREALARFDVVEPDETP